MNHREAPETLSFKQSSENVRVRQAQHTKDEESLELSDGFEDECEPDDIEERMMNKYCYDSLIKYYSHLYPADVVEGIAKILQQREQLPLIPPVAFKVSLVTPKHRRLVNEMIKTLANCKFIVRMFPSVED